MNTHLLPAGALRQTARHAYRLPYPTSHSSSAIGLRSSVFRLRPSERAIALIIVMICIFVLTILAGGFAYSMKVETQLARNSGNETELEWMGRSTVEYCRWVLAMSLLDPMNRHDSLDQPWATGYGFLGPTNAPIAEVQDPVRFAHGSAKWTIVDLESKININSVNETMLQQTFMAMGIDAGQLTPLSNAILDWLDPDDDERVGGAETPYYVGLTPSYEAKNGPIDDLSELLLVKGITPDLYWGSASTNHQLGAILPQLNHLGLPAQQPSYPFGLADVFTPISTGRINGWTCSPYVFQALGLDPVVSQNLVELRNASSEDGAPAPMSILDALVSAGVSRQAAQQLAGTFADRSSTFQVTVDAEIGGYHRTFIAILGRASQRDVQVLNFYWKD